MSVAVVAYLRVSTDEQAAHGGGLADQRALVEAWCRREDRHVARWCVDEGRSGSLDVDFREGLADALATLGPDVPELVVPKLDRLARHLVLQEQLLLEVHRAGGRLRSCVADEDRLVAGGGDDDPTRRLIRQILGAVAEYERGLIKMRMVTGRRRALLAGGFPGGTIRWGWWINPDTGDYEPHAGTFEGDTVLRIQRLRGEGMTWRGIARLLTDEGVPTPRQPKRGRRRAWTHAQVQNVAGESWQVRTTRARLTA